MTHIRVLLEDEVSRKREKSGREKPMGDEEARERVDDDN
jgi:hypothetical protein